MPQSLAGSSGIVFNNDLIGGSNLTLIDCVVQNFVNDGILLEPSNQGNYFNIAICRHHRNLDIAVAQPAPMALV